LINVANTITGCRCRAEDVVHDVFIKLAETVSTESLRQPLAYLVRMVRNLAIDHYRRRTFECYHYIDEEDGLDVPSPTAGPEAMAMHRDLLQQVSVALARFPQRTRKAFEMVRIDEHSLKDAAAELGVSQTLVHFMVREVTEHCQTCVLGMVLPDRTGKGGVKKSRSRSSKGTAGDLAEQIL
jgi:RNA polymerase sigma-70 factor (ECF subfamily)